MIWSGLTIAIPTYKRNDALLAVLASIETQSIHPSLVLILDNNPKGDGKQVFDKNDGKLHIEYLPMGRNIGPAGAFAAAVDHLGGHRPNLEWMLCRGDDNPFTGDVISKLYALAKSSPGAAGIGIFGKSYTGCGVDYIPGGGAPTYHIPTLRQNALNFDADLFFGFEELDLGLKIKRAGLMLATLTLADSAYEVAPRKMSPWRTYFGQRNSIIIAKRSEKPIRRVAYRMARSVLAALRRMVLERSPAQAKASLLGLIDGLRGGPPRKKYIP